MTSIYDNLPSRRAIIDRRYAVLHVDAALAALPHAATITDRRQAVAVALKALLDEGRAEIRRRIASHPRRGLELAAAGSFLVDQLLRIAYDITTGQLYRLENPTVAERLCLVAVGGYGRAELAPFSDIDLMFLSPMRHTPWVEQVVEALLYILWDMGLKVGHSVRTIADMTRAAKEDLSSRTALLEARFLWGDPRLYDEFRARFDADIVAGNERAFIADKLAERDSRHQRMGDSRYLVEPNLKDGKGGLRDLQTLFWIGKFTMHAQSTAELVDKGLFTALEYRQFQRALNHLWAVRINLHDLAGRAEERLTFDVQPDLARRMHYQPRPGISGVERFMRHYFLTAKSAGTLTALFLAHVEDRFRQQHWRPRLWRRPHRARQLDGFRIVDDRIEAPSADFFRDDPRRLLRLFAIAAAEDVDIHPQTMLLATRDAGLLNRSLRHDPQANRDFLKVLTSDRPDMMLRRMNEAGVMGRFIPDFGRVVARMQYDMYHHYTVDEHTIRAIGLVRQIEQGDLKSDHPLSCAIVHQLQSRRVLYVAVLLHDIAKGRSGDHSILGAEVAGHLGPRFGLSEAETDTVAWLVRYHLLMANVAFKRDLTDPKTIADFVEQVASLERLRLLLVLTVVDIRAVGPGIWNNWKASLLTTLYESAEELLRLGHKQTGRSQRVAARQAALRTATAADDAAISRHLARFADSYWLAEPDEVVAGNFAQIVAADATTADATTGAATSERAISVHSSVDPREGTTLVSVYTADQPGLFSRIAGGIAMAGANIVDARIHTTHDGMALDNFVVQDPLGGPFDEPARLRQIEQMVADAVSGHIDLRQRLTAKPLPRHRQDAFRIVPQLFIDNRASNHLTVIEVNALDRPALLHRLTSALHDAGVSIRSAHIATFGERASDTFYVTDLAGGKITGPDQLQQLEESLLAAAEDAPARAA